MKSIVEWENRIQTKSMIQYKYSIYNYISGINMINFNKCQWIEGVADDCLLWKTFCIYQNERKTKAIWQGLMEIVCDSSINVLILAIILAVAITIKIKVNEIKVFSHTQ